MYWDNEVRLKLGFRSYVLPNGLIRYVKRDSNNADGG